MLKRLLVTLPLLAVLLAACGAATPATTAPTSAPAAPTAAAAATTAAAPTSAPAAPTAAAPTTAAAAGPIVVKNGQGTLTLNAPATRIVACSEEAIDFLITLGVKPIGICSDRITGGTNGAPYDLPYFFPKEQIGTPTFVGSAETPSFEQIAVLKPDLIISGVWSEAANEKLAQIAPTFIVDTDAPGYWRDPLLEIGKALGREAQAQQFLTDYDATAKRLAQQLAPVAAKSPNVLFLYSFAATDGTVVLGPTWTGSKPFELFGFKVQEPAGIDLSNGGSAPASPEILNNVTADIVFVIRIKTPDGKVPRYPIDDLLDSLKGPRVIYQETDSTRGSTAPYTDRFVMEQIASLLGATSADAAAAPTSAAASDMRTIKHALGETQVPANPQRVVVLDAMDDVLALGIKPVGAANWIGTQSGAQAAFPAYLDPATIDGIKWLGDNKQPNLEAIIALKPDLILGRTTWHKDIYAELSAIAPTVIIDQDAVGGWRGQFLAYADALNRTPQANQQLAAYDARTSAIKAKLAQLSPQLEVSAVRFDPARIVIYERQIFAGSVLADAGVRRPANQDKDQSSEVISPELLSAIDGDVLFVIQADAQKSILKQLKDNPLWSQLKAVKTQRVHEVSFDIWVGSWTITGANLILDDLERYLKAES